MANSKVIYLNEDTESLAGEEESSAQFNNSEQFDNASNEVTNEVSNEMSNEVSNEVIGETNYGIEGGKQTGGSGENLGEELDENENLEKLNLMKSQNNQDGGNNEILDNKNEKNEDNDEKLHEQNGGESDSDDAASVLSEESNQSNASSVATSAILEMDPMYIRLTKFLQTGGDNNKNLADILLDISNNFEKLNTNLENLTNKMTKMSLQQ